MSATRLRTRKYEGNKLPAGPRKKNEESLEARAHLCSILEEPQRQDRRFSGELPLEHGKCNNKDAENAESAYDDWVRPVTVATRYYQWKVYVQCCADVPLTIWFHPTEAAIVDKWCNPALKQIPTSQEPWSWIESILGKETTCYQSNVKIFVPYRKQLFKSL
jgi:hypothetical protein